MRFRTADGIEHDGVPMTPGVLLKEDEATSDGSVWIVEPGGWRRLLRWEEFLNLFPSPTDNIGVSNSKREAFIVHDDLGMIKGLPNSPPPEPPLAPPPLRFRAPLPTPGYPASVGPYGRSVIPPTPTTLSHSSLEGLRAAVVRVYKAGGKAEGLPVDLDSLRERVADTPQAVIEDKIRSFNAWADMQSNAPAVTIHDPEPPSISTPPTRTKPNPEALRGAVFVASPELREWSTRHDATGRSHMREWFDEKCRNGAGPMFELGVDLENDGLLFDRFNTLLAECRSRDKRAHIWVQGDTEHFQHGQPRADWDRVWRRMDALVEAIKPHVSLISMGLGFDLWEWVPGSRHRDFTEFHKWINAMLGELPGLLIGGRPQAPNSRNHPDEPWHVLDEWNQPCSYYSVEYGKPKPHELDELVKRAAFQNKPAFSENRDRLFNEPYFTYTAQELAETIREYRRRGIACIVANWEFQRERGRRSGPLPHFIYEAMDEPVPLHVT